jgi:hypothetical protein
MPNLELAFAIVVTVLAAAAVVGALVFAVVWEVCAIRRVIRRHHQPDPADPSARYWREHSAVTVPERRPSA